MRYLSYLYSIAIWFASVLCAQTTSSSATGTVFAPPLPTLVDPLTLPRFEIDVIFPRNETYNASASEAFPIALVVQNYTQIGQLGNFTITWSIMPFAWGRVPGGLSYDYGTFTLPTDPGEAPVVLVDSSNVTRWIDRKSFGDHFMLWWNVNYESLDNCSNVIQDAVFNGIMFDVTSPEELEMRRIWNESTTAVGKPANVSQAPECPAVGSVVEVRRNFTVPACPEVLSNGVRNWPPTPPKPGMGDPCAWKLNAVEASSIMNRAASTALARLPVPATSTSRAPEKTNAAPGSWGQDSGWGNAVAAACVVGYVGLS